MVNRFDGDCVVYVVDFIEDLFYKKLIIDWFVESMIDI